MDKERNTTGLISEKETALAHHCIRTALENGASQARVSLSKSVLDSYAMLNGELDKVTHAADRSIYLYVFADGRYGTFSTNMLEESELTDFTRKAVKAVRMLAEDEFRKLPDPSRTAKDALTGRETGLYDPFYEELDSETRLETARKECFCTEFPDSKEWKAISEETEYSDSVDDNYTIDSQGFAGRHTETSFAVCSEITIEDGKGRKYTGYWWESSPFYAKMKKGNCSLTALSRAVAQIGPQNHGSGAFTMVVDRSVSSRLISPVISALNAGSIQQKSSFLEDSIGKRLFPEGFCLMDLARTPGKPGSRYFDTEGVATKDTEVIADGVVKEYFTSGYMALKMGIGPTVEDISRPVVMPFGTSAGTGAEEIMERCGSGIYVTGFNGGNCNPTTGNFSYGIEGFAFENGKITCPVREMVVTGNMLRLWNSLEFAGDDCRECSRWQIPTLAFAKVDFCG